MKEVASVLGMRTPKVQKKASLLRRWLMVLGVLDVETIEFIVEGDRSSARGYVDVLVALGGRMERTVGGAIYVVPQEENSARPRRRAFKKAKVNP